MLTWLSHNWFTVLQSAGIIASLLFTALSWRVDGRVRRITNLIAMTQQHRDLWSQLYQRPGLARVLEPAADVARTPATQEESLFAMLLILHLSTAHHAIRHDLLPKPDRLEDGAASATVRDGYSRAAVGLAADDGREKNHSIGSRLGCGPGARATRPGRLAPAA